MFGPTRIHQELPTTREAAQDRSTIFSDHMILRFQTRIGRNAQLSILSLNAMLPNTPNGFFDHENWETEEQTRARYQRIAGALLRATTQQAANVILLQQTNAAIMTNILSTSLDNDWIIFPNHDQNMLIAMNKQTSTLSQDPSSDPDQGWMKVGINIERSSQPIYIYNVNRPNATDIRAARDTFTNRLHDNGRIIFGGNLGVNIAPVVETRQNITTGIRPLPARLPETPPQLPEFTQGMFFCDESRVVTQLNHTLVPFSVIPGGVARPAPIRREHSTPHRAIIAIDDCYIPDQDNPTNTVLKFLPINEKTIEQYQAWLQTELADDNIHVYLAVNHANERTLAISFPERSPFFAQIFDQIRKKRGIYSTDSNTEHRLFVPLQFTANLHQTIIDITPRHRILQWIDERIKVLGRAKGIIMHKGDLKIEELENLKETIKTQPSGVDYEAFWNAIYNWENNESCRQDVHERCADIMAQRRLKIPPLRLPKLRQQSENDGNQADEAPLSTTLRELQKLLNDLDHSNQRIALRYLEMLEQPNRFRNFFLRTRGPKSAAIQTLRREIETRADRHTPSTAVLGIVNAWKREPAEIKSDTGETSVTNAQLIAQHRRHLHRVLTAISNIHLIDPDSDDEEETKTHTQETIDAMSQALTKTPQI